MRRTQSTCYLGGSSGSVSTVLLREYRILRACLELRAMTGETAGSSTLEKIRFTGRCALSLIKRGIIISRHGRPLCMPPNARKIRLRAPRGHLLRTQSYEAWISQSCSIFAHSFAQTYRSYLRDKQPTMHATILNTIHLVVVRSLRVDARRVGIVY